MTLCKKHEVSQTPLSDGKGNISHVIVVVFVSSLSTTSFGFFRVSLCKVSTYKDFKYESDFILFIYHRVKHVEVR